jgi:hypothetical protein
MASNYELRIREDNAGVPDSIIATATGFNVPVAKSNFMVDITAVLSGGTTYWVTLELKSAAESRCLWYWNNFEYNCCAAWSSEDAYPPAVWHFDAPSITPAFAVYGIPEPVSAIWFSLLVTWCVSQGRMFKPSGAVKHVCA